MRSRDRGHISLQRVLPAKENGISLVEVLVVMVILSIAMASMFASLSIGEISFPISTAKADLQSKARIIMDWISRDVRQAPVWEIGSNNPSGSHMMFRKVVGFDIPGNVYELEKDSLGNDIYVDYEYNATDETITRKVIIAGAETRTWQFSNITAPPFFTRTLLGNNIVALNQADLGNANAVIITLNSQRQVGRGYNVPHALTTEVKIRNE
ncbi:MAG: prepilin-type N-terminal cleavage/methylation domain-containing protein [Candidatus Omnitrophota bacterium]